MAYYSRQENANNFLKGYAQLDEKNKEKFAKLCFSLLNENYIYCQLKDDYNKYFKILDYKELIANYFKIINYELVHDSAYKIIYLKSTLDRAPVKFKKNETIVLLLLRKLYYTKSKEVTSSVDLSVSYTELLEEMNKTGLFKETLKKTEMLNYLTTLKKYKIINCDSTLSADALTIYPTILHAVSEMDLNNIENLFKNFDTKETEDETD